MLPPVLFDAALTAAAVALIILPGLALLLWLLPQLEEDWFSLTMLSAGVSLALFPLLLLWLDTATVVRVSAPFVWSLLVICLLATVWGLWRLRKTSSSQSRMPRYFSLLAAALIVISFAVRLWAIEGINVPCWGDSYQHAMIAQLLVDNGGLFDSWLPYAPLASFNYHFGFHSLVALFHWIIGVDIPRAVLFMGQIVNAVAVLAIYPLAVRLTGSWKAGLLASLAAALLIPHPTYYVNWGRYTQLAGQAILPVALWLTMELVEREWDWRYFVVTGAVVAGLGLTHYRVILMYAFIVVAWWLVYVLAGKSRRDWLPSLAKLALAGAGAGLLLLPWLVHVASGRLLQQQVKLATGSISHRNYVKQEYNKFHDIRLFFPLPTLVLAGVGFLAGLVNRRKLVAFLVLWVAFLFVMANPYWLGLPGTGVVNNFAVYISLYIPASILMGHGMASFIDYAARYSRWAPWLAIAVVVGMTGYALPYHQNIVKSEYVMVTPADEQAMAWIAQNTPKDAKFLINGFMAYGGTTPVGADAGWWLPLLADRQNSIPPQLYTAEMPARPTLGYEVYDLVAGVAESGLDTAAGMELLRQYDITYVYIGALGGRVGNPGEPLLSPAALQSSPDFELVYHDEGVWVFQVLRNE